MNVVNLDKLQHYREMFDADIAELSIESEQTIASATSQLAHDCLSIQLLLRTSWGAGWWTCMPMPDSTFGRDSGESAWEDGRVDPKKIAKYVLEKTLVARSPYDAAIAVLCRQVQPDCDIVMDLDEFSRFYSPSEINRIVEASPLALSPTELHDDQLLFESREEYIGRLRKINTHYNIMIGTYQRFGFGDSD